MFGQAMRQNKCCYQLVDVLPLTQDLPCPVSPFVRASDSLCCMAAYYVFENMPVPLPVRIEKVGY